MKLDSKQLEGFVLLRNGLSMAADGVNKILETTEPKEAKKPTEEQFKAQNWTQKESSKGFYEQAQNDGSENFKIVSQYVKAHSGFCNLYGFKVWLHNQDENVIDRRKQ